MIVVERLLPCSKAAAWSLLCDPVRMCEWSEARIDALLPGDGGTAWGVGATRRVTIKGIGGPTSFREVVVESLPPDRFVYRVFDAPMVRSHEGIVVFSSENNTPKNASDSPQTRLLWKANFELALPRTGPFIEKMIATQLERSMDKLVTLCNVAPAAFFPANDPWDDPADEELFRAAEAVFEEQKALALRLEKKDDPKRWFARVYTYVTDAQLRACRAGVVHHTAWVLRLILRFHEHYIFNLLRYEGSLGGQVEEHWTRAFDKQRHAEKGEKPTAALFRGLIAGVKAHIEEDLPRALAEVYVAHYAEKTAYARFRADYLSMGRIFQESSQRLRDDIPKSLLPIHLRMAAQLLPNELQVHLNNRHYYDVPKERERSFERGERLAQMLMNALSGNGPMSSRGPSSRAPSSASFRATLETLRNERDIDAKYSAAR